VRSESTDLRLFVAVLEAGTIGTGAARVHLSPAAASERLQALEAAFGVRLFERSRRGVRATEAGLAFERQARSLLAQMERLRGEMAPFARGLRGRVKLLCNTAAMTEHLPPRLAAFLAAHPDIDVELQELSSLETLQALRLQRADLGIVADSVDPAGLTCHPFCDDELVAIGAVAALPAAGPLAFSTLVDRPFIGLAEDSGLSRFLARQAEHSGHWLQHRVRVRSFDAVCQLVAAGAGVAVLPRGAVLRDAERPRLDERPLSDAWAVRKLLLCAVAEPPLPACTQLLLDALRSA